MATPPSSQCLFYIFTQIKTLDEFLKTWHRDVRNKVNFMAQIPVIDDPNVFYAVKFRQERQEGRVTGLYPVKKQAFFSSYRDVTGPSV